MKKKCNLLLREDHWKSLSLANTWKDKTTLFLDAHHLVVFLQTKYGMLEERNAIAIPVQEHRQIIFDICLRKIVRKFVEIHYRLGDFQAIRVDSTVRVLSQAEFLSEKRNSFFEFRNGLNGLVQISFVHFVVQGEMNDFVKGDRNSLHL